MRTAAQSKQGERRPSTQTPTAGAQAPAAPLAYNPRLAYVGIFGEDLQREAEVEALATAVAAQLSSSTLGRAATEMLPVSVVIDAQEAAQLLGITVPALYARVSRHRVPGRLPGRRVTFHRETFMQGLQKRARR